MSPPSPHMPMGPLQTHLWKIGTALKGMNSWKGHIGKNSTTNKTEVKFTQNDTHFLQACV